MAWLGRKKVRPGRVTTAVSLGAIGLFVISYSAGMGSWSLGLAGAALLILCVALLATGSMRASEKAFAVGTVHVVKVSEPPLTSEYGRCEMQVLVDAPGHPGQTVVIRDPKVPVAKWPEVGGTLPALVSVSDVRRVKIQWDRVASPDESYLDSGYSGFSQFSGYSQTPLFDEEAAYFGIDPTQYPDPAAATQPDRPPHQDQDRVDQGRDVGGDRVPHTNHRDEPGDPEQSLPEPQAGSGPLPPQHYHDDEPEEDEPAPMAVIEGEVVSADVPVPRIPPPGDDESAIAYQAADISLLDFSDVSEPVAEPTQAGRPGPLPHSAATDVDDLLTVTAPARPASAGSINGVGVTILVTDLARSLQFYRDLLGFYEIDSGPDNVVLASGDTRLLLRATETASVNRRLIYVNLEVHDLDGVHQELKLRGTRFTYGPRVVNQGERLELWAATFRDPDGHGIAITQWKARQPAQA